MKTPFDLWIESHSKGVTTDEWKFRKWIEGIQAEVRRDVLEEMSDWARSRWDDEVKHRPDVNIYKRILDQTWKQMIRECDERLAELKKGN